MAYTLIIARSQFAADSMKDALRKRGHVVMSATNFLQVQKFCQDLHFDLVVLGESLTPKIRKALFQELKKHCPEAPILEVCASQPCISGTDYVLQNDSYEALARSIDRILLARTARKLG